MPILKMSKTLTPMDDSDGCEAGYSTRPDADAIHTMRLVLFQRDDCHLCDLALEVLAQARAPDFSSIFVDHDNELEARYGERVPVLRDDDSGQELEWSFDVEQLRAFLLLHGTAKH